MGARRQGQRTTARLIKTIDQLTQLLGTVEADPVESLRAVPFPLRRLAVGVDVLDRASAGGGERQSPVIMSVRTQLEPLVVLVSQPNVVRPPFSPDLRQRVGYAIAVLLSVRARLGDRPPRLRSKPLLRAGDERLHDLRDRWTAYRQNPSFENLERLRSATTALCDLYWVLGLAGSEPRVRNVRRLCGLLDEAHDRRGDLGEVPALMREITASANAVCRPTFAEHRRWLDSVLA